MVDAVAQPGAWSIDRNHAPAGELRHQWGENEGVARATWHHQNRRAFADFQELRIGPGWHDQALRSLLSEVGRKEGIASWLMGRERLDALMVVFGETDTVARAVTGARLGACDPSRTPVSS